MLERVVLTSSIQAHGLSLTFLVAKMDTDSVPSTVLISSSVATTAVDSRYGFRMVLTPVRYGSTRRKSLATYKDSEATAGVRWTSMETACVPIKMLLCVQACSRPGCTRPRHVTKMKRRIRSRCAACEALASFESRERKKMKLMREHRTALSSHNILHYSDMNFSLTCLALDIR
jgi:hypothetical protein